MSIDGLNHTLTIRNAGTNDSGIYRCLGMNMLGDISTEVELKVGKHCSPKPSSNHKEYEEGKSFTFSCDINVSRTFRPNCYLENENFILIYILIIF